ncbi:MAG: hypothetical protein JW806_05100 [Sedimentisphaerales bacterium]|nr:hypothetical protein [Sedimentisphaerales bacterium]
MEISWITRLRIFAALAVGVMLVGFLPWQYVAPSAEAGEVFAVFADGIGVTDLWICAFLAFVAGFIASAVCTPYGAQIGIIAAPAGLAIWGLKSSPLSRIFQMSPAVSDRLGVYSRLRFEGFIWLVIVACGFAGAVIADRVFRKKQIDLPEQVKPIVPLPDFARAVVAVIGTIFIASFLINLLASDVSYSDPSFRRVTAQPANAQIAFGVFIAFGASAFLAKTVLNSRAYWPAIASVVVISYSIITYAKDSTLARLTASWPAVFFIRPIMAVLPVQMVAFGCLGAVWGYWMAVSFNIWRLHQA